MTIQTLHLGDTFYKQVVLLESHGIKTKIEDSKLLVLEEFWNRDSSSGSQWLDFTNHTINQIKEFLGY